MLPSLQAAKYIIITTMILYINRRMPNIQRLLTEKSRNNTNSMGKGLAEHPHFYHIPDKAPAFLASYGFGYISIGPRATH